mgnify:CR=1 FL=1
MHKYVRHSKEIMSVARSTNSLPPVEWPFRSQYCECILFKLTLNREVRKTSTYPHDNHKTQPAYKYGRAKMLDKFSHIEPLWKVVKHVEQYCLCPCCHETATKKQTERIKEKKKCRDRRS